MVGGDFFWNFGMERGLEGREGMEPIVFFLLVSFEGLSGILVWGANLGAVIG